jgi:HPt (histidine-containing phosphotransfer) domain-containing protein
MKRGLGQNDTDAFRRAAHSLKSNGESFGATRLADLARELEAIGRDGRLEEARPKIPQLESTYEETAQALKALL